MVAALEIKTTPVLRSRLQDIDVENVPFGKYFTDHMLVAEFAGGKWHSAEIKPYQPIQIDPSNAALHYGQSIFEGIKAYPQEDGGVSIFRPYDNFHRFNISALRMQMPEVPEEIFVEGMRQLIALDKDWCPRHANHALYIRPFLFASDNAIGVRPSEKYTFIIILSPTGPYYTAPMRIYVEETYTRAAPGGVGYAKTAGNYAAAMFATAKAQKDGYQQVLWTDAFEHRYVQEIGTMNVFFISGNKALTPSLEEGTILDGITRRSVMTVLQEMGLEVEERRISVDELVSLYSEGNLNEVFGVGTAATVSMIRELKYRDFVMEFDTNAWTVSPEILHRLDQIRYGEVADDHEWMFPV
jgi:branched-chain amino acid aminotransferase